ncbi:hypothetical protein [Candidatus Spongiihabitans sp.]|uniref:hypothetical protein n=1 Tax=Candidatus Spongiihabitans sp. TaxID=3101308 RepID=UPI003C7CC1DE
MNNKQLDTNLSALVQRYGYERVHADLIRFKPRTEHTAVGKGRNKNNRESSNSVSPISKKSSPKKKPNALTTVNTINLADNSKREILIEMAEKFECREFLPHVSEARMLLESLGKKTGNIKSRTQVISRIFRALAEMPITELREINNHYTYTGQSSSLLPIAAAIARAGQRSQE